MISASHLYAVSQDPSYKPAGKFRCHWCDDPCGDGLRHGAATPVQFSKDRTTAKNPSQAWMCKGCWLFRRTRCTVSFHDGRFKDGQCPLNHSWLITPTKAEALERVIAGEPYLYGAEILSSLLQPPKAFALMLLSGTVGVQNLIHRAPANVHDDVFADTVLHFTADNVIHEYTVYELGLALENSENHAGPGVRKLIEMFGAAQPERPLSWDEKPEDEVGIGAGRPPKVNWNGSGGAVTKKVST